MLCLLVLAFFNGCKKDNHVVSPTPVLSEDKDLQILSLLQEPAYIYNYVLNNRSENALQRIVEEQNTIKKALIAKYHLPAATAEQRIQKAVATYLEHLRHKGDKAAWRYEHVPKLNISSLSSIKKAGDSSSSTSSMEAIRIVLPEVTVKGVDLTKLKMDLMSFRHMVFFCEASIEGYEKMVDNFVDYVRDLFKKNSAHSAMAIYEREYDAFRIYLWSYYSRPVSCLLAGDERAFPVMNGGTGSWAHTEGGSTSDGDKGSHPVLVRDIIIDGIEDPCMKNVIQEIKNRAFDPNARDPDLAKIINNFDKNTNVKITVVQGNAIGPDGSPREAATKVSQNNDEGFVATIILDSERIFSGVTKEYLNVLFIHEIVHAYLDYSNKEDLNNHEYMRNNYVIPMTDYLVKHYSLDRKMAAALVMRGVLTSKESSLNEHDTTPKFQYDNLGNQLSEFDLVEAGQYKFGNYGTPKCD